MNQRRKQKQGNRKFTNQIEWTEHKIMDFKPANKYQIIRRSHNI